MIGLQNNLANRLMLWARVFAVMVKVLATNHRRLNSQQLIFGVLMREAA
jgi:hypothetical protein